MNPTNLTKLIDEAVDRFVVYMRKAIRVGLWLVIRRRFWAFALVTAVLASTGWLNRFDQVPWSQIADLLR